MEAQVEGSNVHLYSNGGLYSSNTLKRLRNAFGACNTLKRLRNAFGACNTLKRLRNADPCFQLLMLQLLVFALG